MKVIFRNFSGVLIFLSFLVIYHLRGKTSHLFPDNRIHIQQVHS